ncbi:MAG: DUF2683 family protein [Mucilaginibacter sp.]
MDALIIYPQNEEELKTLKAMLKNMKVNFEQRDKVLPDYVIDGVKESLKQADEDRLTPYTGIKSMLGI